jgi:hypothetical protein
MTTAKHRAIDRLRRERNFEHKQTELLHATPPSIDVAE